MEFYNREKELTFLISVKERSATEAQMTVVVGRRRIGKTSL
jgi:AAA+ ATPase superfamily predicted ATPase